MSRKQITRIFDDYPKAMELYQDERGQIWTTKLAALDQSPGGKVTTIKRNKPIKEKQQ